MRGSAVCAGARVRVRSIRAWAAGRVPYSRVNAPISGSLSGTGTGSAGSGPGFTQAACSPAVSPAAGSGGGPSAGFSPSGGGVAAFPGVDTWAAFGPCTDFAAFPDAAPCTGFAAFPGAAPCTGFAAFPGVGAWAVFGP